MYFYFSITETFYERGRNRERTIIFKLDKQIATESIKWQQKLFQACIDYMNFKQYLPAADFPW